jgi:hypothetical protein
MLRSMTSRRSALVAVGRASSICLLALETFGCVGHPVAVPGFFRYSRFEVKALLERNRIDNQVAWELDRNSDGSRLYVYASAEWAGILESTGRLTVVSPKPAPRAYLNDKGEWAAWLTASGAHFIGWTRQAKGLWADRGAHHYLLKSNDGRLELGTTDGRHKQTLDGGFDPLRIFSQQGKVYVFGVWREANEKR